VLIRDAGDLAQVIRAARRRRAMSQADLAAVAGVSRRWMVALEAGKPRAELALVLRVLNALGVPLHAEVPEEPARAVRSEERPEPVDLDEHLARLAGRG
jgi:HTH-type transcriptional regulator/antitoxin HipB